MPAGDASTTSEWSTILLPTMVHHILEIWQNCISYSEHHEQSRFWKISNQDKFLTAFYIAITSWVIVCYRGAVRKSSDTPRRSSDGNKKVPHVANHPPSVSQGHGFHFSGSLTKSLSKLGHGWVHVIALHSFMRMWLLIHALNLMLAKLQGPVSIFIRRLIVRSREVSERDW